MFTARDKLKIAGLFLSKFDKDGLASLGFESFTEAFNAIALSLKARPASLKNYRDEFDPLFPNPRQGWHKRPIRENCKLLYERFGGMDLGDFSQFLKPLIFQLPSVDGLEREEIESEPVDGSESFAKRLITGAAAEGYFEKMFPEIGTFHNCALTNTTAVGCGFDFKIDRPDEAPYFAVEVKVSVPLQEIFHLPKKSIASQTNCAIVISFLSHVTFPRNLFTQSIGTLSRVD